MLHSSQLSGLLKKVQPQFGAGVRRGILGAAVISALNIASGLSAKADDVAIRIMTQNVYQGTNFDELLAAQTPAEFVAAVTTTYNNILATDPAARAQAVANEIATEQPDVVSLQEISTLLTGTPATTVQVDYLSSLQSDLKALGQNYAVVATVAELNAEAPSTLGYSMCASSRATQFLCASLTVSATLANIQVGHYADNPPLPSAIGPIPDPRGYASVDVTINGATFEFVTTHLNTSQPSQLAQMQELISAETGVFPIVMAGDFNANADDPLDPTYATYQAAINAGFADAWTAANRSVPGYTCCQNQGTLNFPSALDQRIDLELLRGATRSTRPISSEPTPVTARRPVSGRRITPGFIATLEIPRGSLVVPETSTWVMLLLDFSQASPSVLGRQSCYAIEARVTERVGEPRF